MIQPTLLLAFLGQYHHAQVTQINQIPRPPKLTMPEPFFILDFGDLVTHRAGLSLSVHPEIRGGSLFLSTSVTNNSKHAEAVPPVDDQGNFGFLFSAESRHGRRVGFTGYARRWVSFQRNYEEGDLFSLPRGSTISVNLVIPGVVIPRGAKHVLVIALFHCWINRGGKQVEFQLQSAPTPLALARAGTRARAGKFVTAHD